MTVKAEGQNYFRYNNCPINLARVKHAQQLTHDFDLTETEHYHDFVELVFIMRGFGVQVLEDQEYPVSAGDIFVLQGNQRHYFKDTSQIEIVNVMYDGVKNPEIIPDSIKQLEGYKALFVLEPYYRANHYFKNMLRLNWEELAKIEVSINTMFYELEKKQVGYELILNNRLQELIVILSRHYSQIEATEAQSLLRIGKVIEFLESKPDEKICINDLADMTNMSKRNFMRIFKRAVGLSPVNYLIKVRLQKARKLLCETDFQISDITVMCGFYDSNYFIKCFKQAFAITPNKFRIGLINKQSTANL
jgi:AraC-like DNA-binding protein/mannose-6-phosphate isomerase-like protein (cupin superfamily)